MTHLGFPPIHGREPIPPVSILPIMNMKKLFTLLLFCLSCLALCGQAPTPRPEIALADYWGFVKFQEGRYDSLILVVCLAGETIQEYREPVGPESMAMFPLPIRPDVYRLEAEACLRDRLTGRWVMAGRETQVRSIVRRGHE